MNQNENKLVIKKYANRKFYNTELSQYVTLSQIQETAMVRDVMVIDNVSKRDITGKTLLMSLVETIEDTHEMSLKEIFELIRRMGIIKKD